MHMDNICYWKRKYVLHFFPRLSNYNLTILNSKIILQTSPLKFFILMKSKFYLFYNKDFEEN